MNVKTLGLGLFALLSFIARPAFADSGKDPNQVSVLFHCDYPPVSFWNKNTDRPSGFFVDIMNEIARRSGLTPKYACKPNWPAMITAIASGEADLGTLLKSADREDILLFSAPIDITSLSFFARAGSNLIPTRVPDGYTVGVVSGSMSHEQLKKRASLRLRLEDSYHQGIFGLLAGDIDLFAGEDSMIIKRAREAGIDDRIKKQGESFLERERCLVFKKGNDKLLARVNEVIPGFIGSAEYQKIYQKWWGTPTPYWTAKRITTGAGLTLLLVVLGMGLWRYRSVEILNRELTKNIAERKRLEADLRTSLESRDEFLSIASHELRTPLSALFLQLQLLAKFAEESKTGASSGPDLGLLAGKCVDACRQINGLLNKLLDITRIRIGKLTLDRAEVDLKDVTSQAVALMSEEAKKTGSHISVHHEDRIAGFWDPVRISQVVSNLISNALKYGNGKPVEISLRLNRTNQAAEFVIRDQGIGISPEMQQKIFHRFTRDPLKEIIPGLGLGLYIAKAVVVAHGGSIRVESEIGKGSIFTVELPLGIKLPTGDLG